VNTTISEFSMIKGNDFRPDSPFISVTNISN